ncbi:hypothetical protein QUA13_03690 [Microcoleus sp. S28C3]
MSRAIASFQLTSALCVLEATFLALTATDRAIARNANALTSLGDCERR